MGFLVDRGGGLDPVWKQFADKRAPKEEEKEEVDTRTELEKERDWNRKTAIAVGVLGVLPWVGVGLLNLFGCVAAIQAKAMKELERSEPETL
ncbi:MAG TPA: hypothetical protein PLY45_02895 [bacterium]|nr:hypothetical protein [bacterium]